MLIRFWGTRGSIASPGPGTVRYGGNTSCIEVVSDAGESLVLDAGTGVRHLGQRLAASDGLGELQVLLTHCHWDHVQGLPFFEPLRMQGLRVNVRVPAHLITQADRILQAQLDPLFFPITWADLHARVTIEPAPAELRREDVVVRSAPVEHPGGALAYRVDAQGDPGRSVVFAPDSEVQRRRRRGAPLDDIAAGAKVLIHDAMYTEEEYAEKRGWGHSSHLAALELALKANVQLLVLFHHHPDRTDQQVDGLVEECRSVVEEQGAELLVVAAYEGLELEV